MSFPSNRISVFLAGLEEEVLGNQEIPYVWKVLDGSTPCGKAELTKLLSPFLYELCISVFPKRKFGESNVRRIIIRQLHPSRLRNRTRSGCQQRNTQNLDILLVMPSERLVVCVVGEETHTRALHRCEFRFDFPDSTEGDVGEDDLGAGE
jgi:hypothetical protein